ncbi:phenylalanine--tRNA ligase subunit alpha [Desulfovibrio legallii]|jgi:phenylalanyl-tRNA synthetase alpha chain|uniref:Phenylalanine--tRNA ligase alpha subunit n=1 Tax=Desulfovibrio legallii TaxID=571438 RepID=A0A6H3FF95_9BACT|nr:phenylalanine--tRNA ligase subunit alpha [Desulfovibrio legallii]RHH22949.1 phenylalanine--tRNA ligase subunit alpha [Desulfovibrio sp. AM18-2]TBH80850.1 phenylalanine--tRNA ligase subunit alpha [Desulfovibrio legallii]CAI3239645.1 Phenylalanyl-tRNA synthetase alpha chain (EC [Desulfovibrio diazotrophicus]
MDLISALEGLVPELEAGLAQAADLDALEALRVDVLGRKGRIAQIMSQLPGLAPESRPAVGQKANSVKERCNALFEQRKAALEAGREAAALKRFDPSIPGRAPWRGSLHPTTLVMEEICGVFKGLGFDVASGPEVEIDYYNFEALNMPPEHPARDMQDTLYITDKVLMRTHTSPVQVRTMLTRKPPVAVVVPGKVYRRDSDLTHTPMFHQIEGLLVGQGVSLAHLRGTLTAFVRAVFGAATEVRFRPSFFPFTEPSAEVDISCCMCGGKGHVNGEPCRVCKTTGWVEILGCGMVDPAVFEAVGYPADSTGFAFGMGVERVTMLKYGIGDLRMFFENDTRFLSQFTW